MKKNRARKSHATVPLTQTQVDNPAINFGLVTNSAFKFVSVISEIFFLHNK